MAVEECHGIVLAVHGEHAPSDVEWDAYMRMSTAPGIRGLLVLSEGGGPSARQRTSIARFPHLKPLPTAIVTSSAAVRGVVTAIWWLGKNIRAFRPEELDHAFQYLGIGEGLREQLLGRLSALKNELESTTTCPP
jgi:hypothetical protein